MTRTTVVTNGRQYTVSDLEARARGDLHQAVVTARLLDAASGARVTGRTRVSTTVAGLRPVTAPDGYVGLAGVPSRVFPALRTTATPYLVPVLVEADGYLPWRDVASFTAQAGFPGQFDADDLGVVHLHRAPVVLSVSTQKLDAANRLVPLPATTVMITGTWDRIADLGAPAATPHLLALAPGLRVGRPSGGVVDLPTLTAPPEPARFLLGSTAPGQTRLAVSRRGFLSAGDLVALDRTDPSRAEYVEVVAILGSGDLNAPVELELRFPLAHTHAGQGAVARIVGPGPAAPAASLLTGSVAGATTLEVSSLAGVPAGSVVRVSGGGIAPEYHRADHYALTTNADGVGYFPPLTGYVAARVVASAAALGATAKATLTDPQPSLDLTLT